MTTDFTFTNDKGFTIRPFKSDEWQDFKAIRIEALTKHPEVFGSNVQDAMAEDDQYWKDRIASTINKFPSISFVLLNYDGDIIGMTGIVTASEDPSGKTAKLCASYIRDGHKGKGLSTLFYTARIAWARAHSDQFDKIFVSHRKGNEASRRANQAFGFVFKSEAPRQWPDGTTDLEINYILKL